jgi:hypothetical protein
VESTALPERCGTGRRQRIKEGRVLHRETTEPQSGFMKRMTAAEVRVILSIRGRTSCFR